MVEKGSDHIDMKIAVSDPFLFMVVTTRCL